MNIDERIGIILQREIHRNLKPLNAGRLLAIARRREINEKGRDVYVSATLIAVLGFSYETLLDMATNEMNMENVKEGKIRQSLEAPLEKEDDNDGV
tara:strand:- start:669 stop:956 length:288 start_codon:yes stop_codon:yes gene_type:complete